MKPALWLVLAGLAVASAAHANGLDDGNAGLAALNNGQYDRAVSLFTRALDTGGLKGDDREFALASRGRAYLKKEDLSRAIIDLDAARRMKPDDADAQADLVEALAAKAPASAIPGAPKLIVASSPAPDASPAAPRSSFLGELGKALIQGAAEGLKEGLENAGQDSQSPN